MRISDWSSDVCSSDLLDGVMAFGEACQAAGVQPIVGTLLSVARPGQRLANGAPLIDWLALYAQDDKGYDNLCALVSAAHLGRPVEQDRSEERRVGKECVSTCRSRWAPYP